ncbi:MAG: GAF domain-containing protein [Chloroflexota bacterium]
MNVASTIQDPMRLNVLRSLLLLDSPAEVAFDRFTQIASKLIDAPVSLISLIDVDRQFFKSLVGLPEPWASERETPLSHSFCQYVVASGTPLVVEDARKVDYLKDNLAIRDLNVIAYLGIPLATSEGVLLGSFCVIDDMPRVWTEREIEILRELALSVMTEIELRAQLFARAKLEAELAEGQERLRRLNKFSSTTLEEMANALQQGTNLHELEVYVREARSKFTRLMK